MRGFGYIVVLLGRLVLELLEVLLLRRGLLKQVLRSASLKRIVLSEVLVTVSFLKLRRLRVSLADSRVQVRPILTLEIWVPLGHIAIHLAHQEEVCNVLMLPLRGRSPLSLGSRWLRVTVVRTVDGRLLEVACVRDR